MVKINDFFILKHDIDGTKQIKGYDYGLTISPFKNKDFTMELNYNDNEDGSLISTIRNWKIKPSNLPISINLGFGICAHDGELTNPNKTIYSSRLLFKSNVGIQYDKLEIFSWHISNAGLKGENEGNTSLGLKYNL